VRLVAALGALAVAAACGPGTGPPSSGVTPPVNLCPAHPCSAFPAAGSPQCNGGVCTVSLDSAGLILAVSLSEDSFFAPGQTFAIPYEHLFDFDTPATACVPESAVPCAHLPGYGIVQGAYLVTPQEQSPTALDWNLGNPGVPTALPVHVTYRPLWPSGPDTSSAVDADTLGLPLGPLPALVVVDTSPSSPPGPGPGISIGYQANLQPALYEATVQPDPPFDAAFPPDVKRVTIAAGNQNDIDTLAYDTTALETGGAIGRQIPTFALSRVGGLLGWTSYLRDPVTLRRISSLATLGPNTMDVTLPTNHHPADGDALTDAELVIAPPEGVPIPMYKVALQGGQLSAAEAYPTLAAPFKVSGTVTGVDGSTPVEADLLFDAQSIYVAGADVPNTANFEYVGRASARIDPTTATGASTYAVTLPPGSYQLTVRPLDTAHQVTVTAVYTVDPTTGAPAGPLRVDAPRPVQGQAFVADGRALAGAVVTAVPASCGLGTSTLCLPRQAETTCQGDGSFSFVPGLDPGGYTLRVQPQDGTHLPWVTQPLAVGATPVTIMPAIRVPAPMHAAQQLLDPLGNPIVAAVVRVFRLPATGPAVEVGQALTDATGTYDMYLAPSGQ
jgi:hypothetical protein